MKNIYLLFFASLLIVSCGPTNVVVESDHYQPAPVQEVSYQSFYDQLSPYGNWISYPGYGYVWMPNAGADFRPYSSNGNWVYTDAGWTWASNYNWGWAPFHYGRWFFEDGYGWMWIPGNEWAPAWVSWRGSGDYYGWAPLGPHITAEIGYNSYNPPINYWNFVPRRYMGNPGWHNYYVNENRNVTIINNTTIINNYSGTNRARYSYAPGPDPNEVRRVSGNNFQTVQVREASSPGERISSNQYTVYRPAVNPQAGSRADASGRPSTPAPARVQQYNGQHPVQSPAESALNRSGNTAPGPSVQPPVTHPVQNNPGYNNPGYNNRPVAGEPAPQNHPNTNTGTNPNTNKGMNPNTNTEANNYRPAAAVPVQAAPVQTAPMQASRPNNGGNNYKPVTMEPVQHAELNRQNPQRNVPGPSQPNRLQTNSRPGSDRHANGAQPASAKPKPENKPEPASTEKPKS